jgi:cobalt/nickel transport system permease protein
MDFVVTPRNWLVVYLLAVVAITFIHAPEVLAALLVIAVATSGSLRWKLLRRALLAILAFNLTISAGYVCVALWLGNFVADYLLLVNLRVLLLVYIGFWFVTSVDLLGALSGWPLATLLATLAIGQIKTFERILRDFRLAFQSRNLTQPTLIDRSRHAAAQAQTLLDKSLASANEAALAMRSRGAFDD